MEGGLWGWSGDQLSDAPFPISQAAGCPPSSKALVLLCTSGLVACRSWDLLDMPMHLLRVAWCFFTPLAGSLWGRLGVQRVRVC